MSTQSMFQRDNSPPLSMRKLLLLPRYLRLTKPPRRRYGKTMTSASPRPSEYTPPACSAAEWIPRLSNHLVILGLMTDDFAVGAQFESVGPTAVVAIPG